MASLAGVDCDGGPGPGAIYELRLLVQKEGRVGMWLTEGLWWPELLRRAAGVEDGRRRRRSSVTGMTQRCSGLLGSTVPIVAKLRSELGGQDGLSFASGEQLPRRVSSPETASGLKFR